MAKKHEPEYTLNVFHRFDERSKRTSVVFLVQTAKIFVNFQYEILLEDDVRDRQIQLHIAGLHAPTILMPNAGPAQGVREYSQLHGEYLLTVTKQDKSVNEFRLSITPNQITFLRQPSNPFILASTDAVGLI